VGIVISLLFHCSDPTPQDIENELTIGKVFSLPLMGLSSRRPHIAQWAPASLSALSLCRGALRVVAMREPFGEGRRRQAWADRAARGEPEAVIHRWNRRLATGRDTLCTSMRSNIASRSTAWWTVL
jgi:hypothetical protein